MDVALHFHVRNAAAAFDLILVFFHREGFRLTTKIFREKDARENEYSFELQRRRKMPFHELTPVFLVQFCPCLVGGLLIRLLGGRLRQALTF